jgi:hypothetical protein
VLDTKTSWLTEWLTVSRKVTSTSAMQRLLDNIPIPR